MTRVGRSGSGYNHSTCTTCATQVTASVTVGNETDNGEEPFGVKRGGTLTSVKSCRSISDNYKGRKGTEVDKVLHT